MTELLLQHGSYFAIVLVLILTGSGLPIPEEVPVVAAGILSAHGQLHPWLALACCLFGALAGDGVMYWIGYHFGRNVLREHRWWGRFLKPQREAQIEQMIEQHGLKVFFLARFLVGLRSPVYLSAGILRVPFRRFLLIDLFCATTVIGTFFLLSYRYGTAIVRWIRGAEIWLSVTMVLVALAIGIYYWRRRNRRRRLAEAAESEPSESDPPGPEVTQLVCPSLEGLDQHLANVEEVV
jgi:membrane protein DedA with SNARE-associated domain